MSYTNLRDEFLAALSPHVNDISKFCLHSLRAGGVSAAANNGVKDRMFKRHGRWVSESAKDGYIKDSLKERLAVTLSLGLQGDFSSKDYERSTNLYLRRFVSFVKDIRTLKRV